MELPTLFSTLIVIFLGLIVVFVFFKKDRLESSKKNKRNANDDIPYLIVHELRSPITAIKNSAETLISGKSVLTNTEKKQFLELIYQQSKLLLEQIQLIMDVAKLDAGKLTITKTQGNMGEFISQQTKIFLLSAKKKNISLNVEIEDTPIISFDPIHIGQVLNNLISNSLKFTQEGGKIYVKVGMSNPTANYLTVSVADTGRGIPKDFQKRLFSKFSQSPETPQEIAKQGTGLGLYLTKGIIDAHKGTINVESEEGKGTTISFNLPI